MVRNVKNMNPDRVGTAFCNRFAGAVQKWSGIASPAPAGRSNPQIRYTAPGDCFVVRLTSDFSQSDLSLISFRSSRLSRSQVVLGNASAVEVKLRRFKGSQAFRARGCHGLLLNPKKQPDVAVQGGVWWGDGMCRGIPLNPPFAKGDLGSVRQRTRDASQPFAKGLLPGVLSPESVNPDRVRQVRSHRTRRVTASGLRIDSPPHLLHHLVVEFPLTLGKVAPRFGNFRPDVHFVDQPVKIDFRGSGLNKLDDSVCIFRSGHDGFPHNSVSFKVQAEREKGKKEMNPDRVAMRPQKRKVFPTHHKGS